MMRALQLFLILAMASSITFAQDSTKTQKSEHVAIEIMPEYPGGIQRFYSYVSRNLVYPEVAQLIGLNGNVKLSFVVEKDGSIADIKPLTCIGAGCEAEAVRILSSSPKWMPGMQNGKFVRVQYTMPVSFNVPNNKAVLKDFKKSSYGFIFKIDGKEYSLEEAETILGNSFPTTRIESAIVHPNQERHKQPKKKEVYLVTIRPE